MQRASLLLILFLLIGFVGILPTPIRADTEKIKDQIETINEQKAALDREIAQYQQQLNTIGAQKQTLQTAIQGIDVTRQKTATQIQSIQKKIQGATLKLTQLSEEIKEKEASIAKDRMSVAESLRIIATNDDATLIEQLFSSRDIADAWQSADELASVNSALRAHAAALAAANAVLAEQHAAVSGTKTDLSKSNTELSGQKKALDVQKAEKDQLLSQTKNTESAYQALIAQKKAQQKAFENQLASLESQLKSVGQGNVPSAGSGILAWPFSDTFMQGCAAKKSVLGNIYCVTQYFGNTSFSTANPQIYNGSGHNAIDIGAPSGTPLQAALAGTVRDTGNTDASPGCYSFGKWVMITHANGLDTLYTHLSSISVTKGQSVSTGEIIGYTGMTGYATGPHVHFGVYASAGVQITTLSAYRNATSPCANAKMPVAPVDAYLNPMSYL